MSKRNVFIIGLDPFNRAKLDHLPQAEEGEFHAALDVSDIRNVDAYDIQALIDKATRTIEDFKGSADAVATYWDFPGTLLVAILAQRFGVPGPSLDAMFKCEHKYWSRLEQHKAIPHDIPYFRAFDPFDDAAFGKLQLMPPFWIKPIKSFRSFSRLPDQRRAPVPFRHGDLPGQAGPDRRSLPRAVEDVQDAR